MKITKDSRSSETRQNSSLPQVEIRRLKAGDEAEAIRAIHVLKPSRERDGRDATPKHMRALLEADLNYLIVASADTSPIGFLLAYGFPRVDRDKNMIYLYEIDVLPEYRRRGIGSGMTQLLKDECQNDQIMKIWVGTDAGNSPARKLFESTGAICDGESYAEYVYKIC